MFFNSLQYAAFFATVFLLVFTFRNRVPVRNLILLLAGYFFYACWDWRFVGLLMFSTLLDYVCGRLLDPGDIPMGDPRLSTRRRKWVVAVSVGLNLLILGFFKYFNFFADSAVALLGAMGIEAHHMTLRVILPVGISFYTFQSISYSVEVYRARLRPEHNLLTFAVYVGFFPQLVAGPIERPFQLLPQMSRPSVITWDKLWSGFFLICWGLVKKVVFANNAATIANACFNLFDANPAISGNATPSAGATMIGIYAFALQIYCDFSAYTDIARGSARCMGFELMENFNLPYLATNPSDFWRRWHISLSSWLRDYVYIPLGGNRKGNARTYVNLMLTMVIGGLWHGAAWTFVLWGAFHGALLCAHRAIEPTLSRLVRPQTPFGVAAWRVVRVIFFFHLVCFGWLLFRAQSLEQVGAMLAALARPVGDTVGSREVVALGLMLALMVLAHVIKMRANDNYVLFRMPVPVRAVVYAGLIFAFLFFGDYGGETFIYFQF